MNDIDQIADAPSAARAAAIWWARQVGAPTFRSVDAGSSMADQANGAFAGMMATMLADRNPVTAESGTAFADELERRIDADVANSRWGLTLGVDYGPDLLLAEAATATGVSASRFPWKTMMHVHADYVTAALGYGSPARLIWASESWLRPACGNYHYEGNQSFDEVCPQPKFHDGDCGQWIADPSLCDGCGLGYTAHYAGGYKGHTWKPVVPADAP